MADWYCNFLTGDDTTGDGSSGNPYKTIQKALTTMSTSENHRVFVMASEPLASPLTIPNNTNGLLITGSEAVSVPTVSSATNISTSTGGIYCKIDNLKLVNGSAWSISSYNTPTISRCEIVLAGQFTISNSTKLVDCYIHGTGGTWGVYGLIGSLMLNCVVDISGVGVATVRTSDIVNSLIICRDTSRRGVAFCDRAMGNTVVAPAGSTAAGIDISGGFRTGFAVKNLVVGYGVGIDNGGLVLNNSFYDCTTNVNAATYESGSDDLASDPFVDSADENFAPVDVGNLSAGGFSWWAAELTTVQSRYRGAIQPGGGGSTTFNPFLSRAFGAR